MRASRRKLWRWFVSSWCDTDLWLGPRGTSGLTSPQHSCHRYSQDYDHHHQVRHCLDHHLMSKSCSSKLEKINSWGSLTSVIADLIKKVTEPIPTETTPGATVADLLQIFTTLLKRVQCNSFCFFFRIIKTSLCWRLLFAGKMSG